MTTVKALVIGVATVSVFFAAMNAAASVLRQPLNQAIFDTASTNLSAATLPPGEPSWTRGDGRKWVEWRGRQAGRGTTAAEGVASYAFQRWRDVGVTFLVACAWLRATRRTRRGPLPQDGDDPSGVAAPLLIK